MKSLLLPLLAAIALPYGVNAAEINCNSPVWKKSCFNKKNAKLKEPKFCKNENLSVIQKEECLSIKTKKRAYEQPTGKPLERTYHL